MATKKTISQVNMTSTKLFKLQAENIFNKLRQENSVDGKDFIPTHMGGIAGQRDLLTGMNVMRELQVVN